jgi:hypothetical protein
MNINKHRLRKIANKALTKHLCTPNETYLSTFLLRYVKLHLLIDRLMHTLFNDSVSTEEYLQPRLIQKAHEYVRSLMNGADGYVTVRFRHSCGTSCHLATPATSSGNVMRMRVIGLFNIHTAPGTCQADYKSPAVKKPHICTDQFRPLSCCTHISGKNQFQRQIQN